MTYSLKDTPDGLKTLVYTKNDGKKIRLHSAYKPLQEAERAVSKFSPGRSNFIVVFGLALAYHVELLKSKYPDHTLIVIERHREVISIARKINEKALSGVYIFNSLDELSSIFEDIDIASFRGFATYMHRSSYGLAPDFYDDFLKEINRYISSKVSDLLTRFEFEKIWVENILKNIHNIYDYPGVINLFGKFKGYPGIIVSAGPSLKNNIKDLQRLKDKALIVAVDTSLKVLLKNNITPHIVMVLDAQKHSIKHFLGLKNQSPILLADVVSCPRVLDIYGGKKLMSTTAKYYNTPDGDVSRQTTPFMDWIEQYIEPMGDIQSGGSVATSLFDFLLNTGCNSIILLGQDLAYTGREIHSSGTHHNENWLQSCNRFSNLDTINQKIIRKRKISKVRAYGNVENQTVVSDFVLDLYRHWFEDSAHKIDIPVINATEGGAKIKNTREESLSSLAENLPEKKNSPSKIIKKYLSYNSNSSNLKLKNGILKAIDRTEELLEMVNNNGGDLLKELSDEFTTMLYSPFLKKTEIYISRHEELSDEKVNSLLSREVKNSSTILQGLLKLALNNING